VHAAIFRRDREGKVDAICGEQSFTAFGGAGGIFEGRGRVFELRWGFKMYTARNEESERHSKHR